MAKIDIRKELEEAANLKRQIATLEQSLSIKKKLLSKYFSVTGKGSLNSFGATAFVQTKVSVEYDIPKLEEKLDKQVLKEFIEKNYVIQDWSGFIKLLKSHGVSKAELRPFLYVDKKVNKEKLEALYEKGSLSLEALEGCYTAKVVKSVALRLNENAEGRAEQFPAAE